MKLVGSKARKEVNSISAYREINISENQEMYPHCFVRRNKAWGRKNIENKANFKIGKIDVSSLLTSEYENYERFVAEKNKPRIMLQEGSDNMAEQKVMEKQSVLYHLLMTIDTKVGNFQ